MLHEISTMAGVTELDQPTGTVMVERDPGSTCFALHVSDGRGGVATVFLDSQRAAQLVFAVGAASVDL